MEANSSPRDPGHAERRAADFRPAADLVIPPGITDEDLAALTRAVATLEHTSLATRLNAMLGRQIDFAAQFVPAPILSVVNKATVRALGLALRMAVRSLGKDGTAARPRPRLHVAAAALSGAAGGGFGLSALPLELPISTSIMLRTIAEVARTEGEDLADPNTLLACLEVFALGGDDGPAGESSYLAMRSLLAKSVSEAARYLVQRGAADEAAPAIVRLLAQIAPRFGVAVGQKAMTQAIPLIGAATGAAVNIAFTTHFQSIAHAHFTVRRLERRYGVDTIRALFNDLKARQVRPGSKTAVDPAKAIDAPLAKPW